MSSRAPQQPTRDLRFFLTVPHACSYLPDREVTTLFLDPQESPGQGVHDALALLGFRRSGRVYGCEVLSFFSHTDLVRLRRFAALERLLLSLLFCESH